MSLFSKEQSFVLQAPRKGPRGLRGEPQGVAPALGGGPRLGGRPSDGEALPQCGLHTPAIATRCGNRTAVDSPPALRSTGTGRCSGRRFRWGQGSVGRRNSLAMAARFAAHQAVKSSLTWGIGLSQCFPKRAWLVFDEGKYFM